jgi:hypothetical protein
MFEAAELFGIFLEERGEVGEDFHRGGTEVMFDALDVTALSGGIEAEHGKKAGESFVAVADAEGDFAALGGEDEAAVFLVFEVTGFGEFLHHAGHGRLADFERGSDVHDAGIAFFLEQLVDAFEVILRALARGRRCWHRKS